MWYGLVHIAYQLPYDLRINNNDYVIRIAFSVITGLIDVLLSIHISIVSAFRASINLINITSYDPTSCSYFEKQKISMLRQACAFT